MGRVRRVADGRRIASPASTATGVCRVMTPVASR